MGGDTDADFFYKKNQHPSGCNPPRGVGREWEGLMRDLLSIPP